jgi:hypothetical protein
MLAIQSLRRVQLRFTFDPQIGAAVFALFTFNLLAPAGNLT